MKVTIDIDKLFEAFSQEQIDEYNQNQVCVGYSDTLLDALEDLYGIERKLREKILASKSKPINTYDRNIS
jgi:hypothetical protein